jgi:hypothetical protein
MKCYLGDAVYAEYDGARIILTTENGVAITNTIILDPEVCQAFSQFIHSLRAPVIEKRAPYQGEPGLEAHDEDLS